MKYTHLQIWCFQGKFTDISHPSRYNRRTRSRFNNLYLSFKEGTDELFDYVLNFDRIKFVSV